MYLEKHKYSIRETIQKESFGDEKVLTKTANALLVFSAILLATSYVIVQPALAQFDFDAFLGAAIPDGSIDGTIGSEWDDAGHSQPGRPGFIAAVEHGNGLPVCRRKQPGPAGRGPTALI